MATNEDTTMTDEELELEKKVNTIYEARKQTEKPSKLRLETLAIKKRIEQGEEVSLEEINALQERAEKEELKAKLEFAKHKPQMDQIMGKSQLHSLAEKAHADEMSAYMLKEKKNVDPIEQALIDQFSATHSLGMKLIGNIYSYDQEELTTHVIRELTRDASKMIQLSHRTAEILHKYRTGGKQTMTVQHQYVQVNHGIEQSAERDLTNKGGGYIEELPKTSPCINDMLTTSAAEKVRR